MLHAPPVHPEKLRIWRRCFSATDGEVLLIYDGTPISSYSYRIRLDGRGAWTGHDDNCGHEVASCKLAWSRREIFHNVLSALDQPA